MGASMPSPSLRGDKGNHGGLRARASLDSYGPNLQRTTSGLAFDDSDENTQRDLLKTPTTVKTNRSPFSRSVLRELNVRAIRNSALAELANVAASAKKK